MIRRWSPIALLLLGALTGCEPVVEPVPETPPAGEAFRQLASDGTDGTAVDAHGNQYTLVKGRIPSTVTTREASRVIGAEGGSLSLGGHTLSVPAGAVAQPTLFLMTLLASGYVEVELLALVADPLGGTIDVGEAGFARPVTISLTYAWAEGVDDPSRLRVLHMREDGLAEPVPSTVSPTGKTVTATLEHFSRYCMGMD